VELLDKHLLYNSLHNQLLKVSELTNFELPIGAYYFQQGNSKGLNNNSKFYIYTYCYL
jgi:hypothetical protein